MEENKVTLSLDKYLDLVKEIFPQEYDTRLKALKED